MGESHVAKPRGKAQETGVKDPYRTWTDTKLSGPNFQRNIFVACDEAKVCLMVDLLLAADGHMITTAASGEDALRYLKGNTPDLVILDLQHGTLDSIEICSRLKQVSRFRNVPVVILAMVQDGKLRDTAKAVYADAVVLKPLSGRDLRSVVRKELKLDELAA